MRLLDGWVRWVGFRGLFGWLIGLLARSLRRGQFLRSSRLLRAHLRAGVHSDPLIVQENRPQPPQRGASREGHAFGLADLPIEQHMPLLGEQQQRVHAQPEPTDPSGRSGRKARRARRLHHQLHAARRRLVSTPPRSLPPPRAAPCGAALRSAA